MEVLPIALETVRDLVAAETKFLCGVSNQVREVAKELGRMQAFLIEAEKRQLTDERIHNCVNEIRRLAYGIEDVLDNFAIEVASRRKGRGMKKVLKRYACIFDEFLALRRVGKEIEDIKTSLANLRTSLDTYGVIPFTTENDDQGYRSKPQRQTYPDEIEEYFVGMDKDITHLVSLITDDHKNAHRVISIQGMGGIGKTTLARKIYNHNDVQKCFEAFAWVTITQKLDEETILLDILRRLLAHSRRDNVMTMGKRDLVEELRKEQKNRKCLVVLDDMWEREQWKTLSSAFPLKDGTSKVLITTRNKILTDIGVTYPLGFLSEDEGWELLRMKAFGRTIPEDVKMDAIGLEYIGREVIRKCGYLPLAISVLGGILSERRSLAYWKDVSKDVDLYLTRSDKSDEEYGPTLQVLALSYNSLPYHLKPCFLHLVQFQEDEDIEIETLYLMWIAEGMISSSHRRKEEDTLMDVAQLYLFEMASRSLVQVKVDDLSISKRISSFRLHDLWRDFCLAYGEKVEFLKILDFRGGKDPVSNSPDNNPRRYSIYMDFNERREDMVSMAIGGISGQLRSFYLCSSISFGGTHMKFLFFQKFKFLKVLLIENYEFVEGVLPKGIKKLIHLRFLGLRWCELEKLPQWISKLQYLQVLDLRVLVSIVPNCLWKLKQLRHLYLPEMFFEGTNKLSLTGLTNLETLVNFDDGVNEIKDLSEMINLRRLHAELHGNRSLAQFLNHTSNHLHRLRETSLCLDYALNQDTDVVPLEDVFKCMSLFHLEIYSGACNFEKFEIPTISNLDLLVLDRCKTKGDPMEALGKLSNLQYLKLTQLKRFDEGFICENMFCDSKAFPKLKSLKLEYFGSLKKWVVYEGAMPNLSNLKIKHCHRLEMIPDGLRFLTALKKLKLLMPKSFNDRVRVIDGKKGLDFDKVSHVPFISLNDSEPVAESSSEEEISEETSEDGDNACVITKCW